MTVARAATGVLFRAAFACVIVAALVRPVFALEISNRYRSPRNAERKVRASTELIVLHTTEAPAKSSLNKLSDRGEAHFCVTDDGSVYRIVDRDREAFHAGRSMWRGKEDVDKFSIGIECVGYHDKPMGAVQLASIRELVKKLQEMYRLSDDKVVCHSHVAYGSPNKWQKKRHRGRKRCGMLFAMPSVRARLGLTTRPGGDPDTLAKRLVVGDNYLASVLYGKVDTMAGRLEPAVPTVAKSSSGGIFSWFGFGKSRQVTEPEKPSVPPPQSSPPRQAPRPVVTAKPSVAGGAKVASAVVSKAKTSPRSIRELKARGYVLRGKVTRGRTASQIVGGRWNSADTYYTIRNKVIPGNAINQSRIEVGMAIWTKK